MDQSKHRHVTYVNGANAASQEVNNPLFMAVTELQDEVYEVEKAKKMIIFYLPIQLSYLFFSTPSSGCYSFIMTLWIPM